MPRTWFAFNKDWLFLLYYFISFSSLTLSFFFFFLRKKSFKITAVCRWFHSWKKVCTFWVLPMWKWFTSNGAKISKRKGEKKEGRKEERNGEREKKRGRESGSKKKERNKMSIPRTECSFQESVKFLCSHLSFRAWDFMLQPRSDPGKSVEARDI